MGDQRGEHGKAGGSSAALAEIGARLLDLGFQDQIRKAVKGAAADTEGGFRFGIGFLSALIVYGIPFAVAAPFIPWLTISILALLGIAFCVLSGLVFSTVRVARELFDVYVSRAQQQIDDSNRSMYALLESNSLLVEQMTRDGILTTEAEAEIRTQTLEAYAAHLVVLLRVADDHPAVRKVLIGANLDQRALGPGESPPVLDAKADDAPP